MAKLVLVRHGESQWNLENRFTGWVDIHLTEKGKFEARNAGKLLQHIKFDQAFTSVLIRAIETLELALQEAGQTDLPVIKDKALNERMYGDLQGLNKAECAAKFGEEQVLIWRRSYDTPPPGGESLKDTAARTIPYFNANILPMLKEGKNIIVSAHGNSLRSIVMELDGLTKEEVIKLNIPNGVPIVYEVDNDGKVLDKQVLIDERDAEKVADTPTAGKK
jgi:2,3-bisphosphoglycerate-dependent phosphoglycerate mutase